MIVAMDIGNTNIKAAVFEGSRLVKRWRCATDSAMTSDQYGIIMADLFRYHNLNMQAVEGIMISSVVPTINYTIEHMCRDYFHLEPRLLVPGMKTGLKTRVSWAATVSPMPSRCQRFTAVRPSLSTSERRPPTAWYLPRRSSSAAQSGRV